MADARTTSRTGSTMTGWARTADYLFGRNALIGLKGLQYAGATINQIGRQMLKYLGEPDYANIVQNALDIIEKLPLGTSYDAQWRKLDVIREVAVQVWS